MGLSSNTIIHFTKKKEALEGILKNNFNINYCIEKILLENKSIEFFVPMVSFCDIPLSQVKNHIDSYGSYGIGLTKKWAERQKLNPVLYTENNSSLSKSLRNALVGFLRNQDEGLKVLEEKEKSLLDILRYVKNYQADLIRKDMETIPNYRFSDEREWRYVLGYDKTNKFLCSANNNNKADLNNSILGHKLKFEPNDIKYVIINNDSEIKDFIEILREAKSKYNSEDVERLITRIITTEQIREDF